MVRNVTMENQYGYYRGQQRDWHSLYLLIECLGFDLLRLEFVSGYIVENILAGNPQSHPIFERRKVQQLLRYGNETLEGTFFVLEPIVWVVCRRPVRSWAHAWETRQNKIRRYKEHVVAPPLGSFSANIMAWLILIISQRISRWSAKGLWSYRCMVLYLRVSQPSKGIMAFSILACAISLPCDY